MLIRLRPVFRWAAWKAGLLAAAMRAASSSAWRVKKPSEAGSRRGVSFNFCY